MRWHAIFILFFGIVVSSNSQGVCDSTFTISNNSFANPYNPTSFNNYLASLDELTCNPLNITVTLNFNGLGSDTAYLSGALNLNPQDTVFRTDFTVINSNKVGQRIFLASVNDNNPIISVGGPHVNILNTGFLTPGSSNSIIAGAGATNLIIASCEFILAGDSSAILINEDSVLVEKSFFKNTGNTLFMAINNYASVVEVRSNLFLSSGITSNGHGIHILANTFVGEVYQPAIDIKKINSPENEQFKIQHNLFAFKPSNSLPPPIIAFSDNSQTDSIVRNAYVRGISPLINGAGGVNPVVTKDNVILPTGLADYDNGDYPLVQMRTDISLNSDDPSFGLVPEVYKNFTLNIPTIQSTIGEPAVSGILFQNFSPHVGTFWSSNMRVGCFDNYDPVIIRPSPIGSISFAPNQYTISQTFLNFDSSYYGQEHTTQLEMFYFMSRDRATLVAAQDTNGIENRNYYWDGYIYQENGDAYNFPTQKNVSLPVPDSLRTGVPIYVKMVHKNANGFAVVDDTKAIQTVSNVPEYPQTDFSLILQPNDESQHQNGIVNLLFTKGVENIQSVQVEGLITGDSNTVVVDTVLSDEGLGQITFSQLPDFQTVFFRAFPIGNSNEIGKDTVLTPAVPLDQLTADLVYVTPRASCLLYPLPDEGRGELGDEFCQIERALNLAATRPITIVVGVHNDEPAPIRNLNINENYGTLPLTIVSQSYREMNTNERPVLRSLIIDRPNTTVKGFILENEIGTKPAVTLKKNQINFDGNVLRFSSSTAFTGELIRIEGTLPNDSVHIKNNVLFNGTPSVMLNGFGEIQIINNTFISTTASAIGISRTTAIFENANVVVANNFFAGDKAPHSMPFSSNLTPNLFVFERNGFAESNPDYSQLASLVEGVPQLQPVKRSPPFSFASHSNNSSTFLSIFVQGRLEDVLTCEIGEECSPLSLSASPNYQVETDLFGNTRSGLHDVGALEHLGDSAWVSGQVTASSVPNRADSILVNVSSLNYDPVKAPFLYVWWDLGANIPTRDSARGDTMVTVASIDQGGLLGLSFNLGVNGLEMQGNRTYTICHAFGTVVGENSHGSCIEFTTDIVQSTEGCSQNDASVTNFFCPDGLSWPFDDATFGNVVSSYTWSTPSNTYILNPISGGQVTDDIRAQVPKLDLISHLPYIRSEFDYSTADSLLEAESFFNIQVVIPQVLDSVPGMQLYSKDENGRIYLVPKWSFTNEGPTTKINIESKGFTGTFYFSTGAAVGQATGTVIATNLTQLIDTSTTTVRLDLSGSQFITRNPLIFVTAVPTGSIGNNVYANDYFSQPILVSNHLAELGPQLSQKWGLAYLKFLNQGAASAQTPPGFGKIPVSYSVDSSTLANNISNAVISQDIDLNGVLSTVSLDVSIQNDEFEYVKPKSKRKLTRGIEFVVTIYDAGRLSFSRTMVASRFPADLLQKAAANLEITAGTPDAHFYDLLNIRTKTWELFSYPWLESTNPDNMFTNAVGESGNWDEFYQAAGQFQNDQFISYNGNNPENFSVDQGKAVWVAKVDGAIKLYLPNSNGGQTLDNNYYSLPLVANQWNDFGLPFNFPIHMQDILDASNNYTGVIWEYDPTWYENKTSSWNELTPTSVLHPWKGYTTKHLAPASLVFPNIDSERTLQSIKARKKKYKEGEFRVSILASNSTGALALSMGKETSPIVIGEAPLAPGQNFKIYLKGYSPMGDPEFHSRNIQNTDGTYNSIWPLAVKFSKKASIHIKPLASQGLPEGVKVWLFNATQSQLTLLDKQNPIAISHENVDDDYSLIVGSSEYANSLKNQEYFRFSNFPNPFSGITRFVYTLPPTFTFASGASYTIKIFNIRGEAVLVEKGKVKKGNFNINYHWNGKDKQGNTVPSGNYIASISVETTGQEALKTYRKLVKLD